MGSALAALEFCLNQAAEGSQPIKRTRAVVVAILRVEEEKAGRGSGRGEVKLEENQKNHRVGGKSSAGTFANAELRVESLVRAIGLDCRGQMR
jgi:hypothetical protein